MFCNIAAYKFVPIDNESLPELCKKLKEVGTENNIKGTVLLSTEGINLFLASTHESIATVIAYLKNYPCFDDLSFKYSYSSFIPFKKLCVKIRPEIVTFKRTEISPEHSPAPYITPEEFRNLLREQADILILDTRNTFEFAMGTFEAAQHLNIDNFREFPEALHKLSEKDKAKPIVTFCTGGIRCEKAAAFLLRNGCKEVYQLQGGILNYFEKCGGDFYNGSCFVFDDRIALNHKLEPVESE